MPTTRSQTTVTSTSTTTTRSSKTRSRITAKSGKVANKISTRKNAVQEDSSSSEEEEVDSDWEEARRRRKRRKTAHKSTPAKKKPVNYLSSILALPTELQLEIFSWLSPKDLLALSRANKELYKTMMDSTTKMMWKSARENEGVPEPSPGMSEMQWATLLFDNTRCEVCGTPGILNIDFGIRRRACTGCRKDNLVFTLKFRKEYQEYDEVILDMIPYTNLGGWARHPGDGRFYWLADIIDMSKKWATLQDGVHRRVPGARKRANEFLESRGEFVKSIVETVSENNTWLRSYNRRRREEKRNLQKARRAEIERRFQELGYLHEDITRIYASDTVNQNKGLTDRGWKRIRPALEATIQQARSERVIWQRKKIFGEVFSDYVKTLSPHEWNVHPGVADVMDFSFIDGLINAPWDVEVTREDLQAVVPQIPAAVSSWQEARKREFREAFLALKSSPNRTDGPSVETPNVTSSAPTSTPGPEPLDLATAVFICTRRFCSRVTSGWGRSFACAWFGWEGLMLHSCRAAWNPSLKPDPPMSLIVSERGYDYACELVRQSGLDPKTATVADMDQTGHRWFCTTCKFKQELVHDWRGAVAHAMSHEHNDTPVGWKLAISSDKEPKRIQPLSEPKLRDRVWGCGHCDVHFRALDTLYSVERHLEERHGIDTPVEGRDKLFFASRTTFQPVMEECRSLPS